VTVGEQSFPPALGADALGRLERRAAEALRLARRGGGPAVASVTAPLAGVPDPAAAIIAARRRDDPWFCLELPERDGFALTALGQAALIEEHGAARFERAAGAAATLAGRVLGDEPSGPAGSGAVLVGGFSFAPDGGSTPEWSGLAPVRLVLPELALARSGGETLVTLCVAADGDETSADLVERALARLAAIEPARMPLLDPDPLEATRVASAAPPAHYESAVARGVERIRAGELEKVVLAREVRAHAAAELDPAPVFDALRAAFPGCYCWCTGVGKLAFVGASPELLVRREGARAQTVALAGTTRRSADPAVDDHLGEQLKRSPKDREEQAIVARRIERTLAPVSLWVAGGDAPELVKVQNVQHLATAIRAQLAEPLAALELAGLLHPTPAVCGEPREVAEPLIPALEGLDRGWYAGGIGWTDLAEDGEFCVALRCALIRGSVSHLYAGCGIVRDSSPAAELEETEVKLQALLPLLS
jgi:salicylate biosynthesis isochorismate synthase/menaquinone-specific isochorismate synthase